MAARARRRKVEAGARERILAAARELFAQHGFEATSTKDVAARAGVPSGLVFYYFETKDALIDATFENNPPLEIVALMWDAAREQPEDPLAAGIRAAYFGTLAHRYQAYILMAEIGSSRPITKRLRQLRKDALAAYADFFRAQSAGTKTPVAPELLAQVVSASLISAALLDQPSDPEPYIAGLTVLVRNSLQPIDGT